MKKPIYKKWWFWVVVVIFIGGLGNALNKDSEPKKADKTAAVSKTESKDKKEAEKKEEPKTFKVGDTVELKDFKVTVNKVYTVKGDEFTKPQDGNEFFAVDCTVENISKEEKTVSSMAMFKVVDKDGRDCEYSITGVTAAKAGQMDGNIGAGRKLTGVYVVEVPKGKKGLELVFDSTFIAKGQVVVQLR